MWEDREDEYTEFIGRKEEKEMYDAVVIGGGVVGGMILRELSAYNLKLCLLEKENDVAMGTSKANSAIVHAGFDAKTGSLKAKLNVRGSELMEKTAKELGVKYKRNGSIVVGFDEEDQKMIEELLQRGKANGVKELSILNAEELREIEPNITEQAICALYVPTGAIICPYELNVAAVGNAMDNGAELLTNFEVTEICDCDGGYEIKSKERTVKTRYVINAAGLYADAVARMAGDDSIDIHPRRGEYMLLDKGTGTTVSHTIFKTPSKMGKGILVTPTVDGNLLLGPTSEDMVDKADTSTTAEGLALVKKQVCERVKSVAFNQTITSFCGLRAIGNTGDFIIRSPKKGFINVAGIESPGLSASPAIAEYVVNMLAESGLVLTKKEDFNPIRKPAHWFQEASMEEKNKVIATNPSYGKIICRCEGVSEGEIREAIRTNPPATDLDGIKRRTRAQMGRCQGGCMPAVTEILAEELNIQYEAVTKFGKGSVLTMGKTKEVLPL